MFCLTKETADGIDPANFLPKPWYLQVESILSDYSYE